MNIIFEIDTPAIMEVREKLYNYTSKTMSLNCIINDIALCHVKTQKNVQRKIS